MASRWLKRATAASAVAGFDGDDSLLFLASIPFP
jgi:hypothetical protein